MLGLGLARSSPSSSYASAVEMDHVVLSTMRPRLLAWLSVCLAAVYWGIGLPFTLLFLNYDAPQRTWLILPYVWEVPILGFVFVGLPAWYGLRPVTAFFRKVEGITDAYSTRAAALCKEALHVRLIALTLPLRLPLYILAGSFLGYCLGTVQAMGFAGLPWEEGVKNIVFGIPTGLLYGVLSYFIVSEALRPVVERCERLLVEVPAKGPGISVFGKILACLLVTAIDAVSVMGLMAYTTSQRVLEHEVLSALPQRLALYEPTAGLHLDDMVFGTRAQLAVLPASRLSTDLPEEAVFIVTPQGTELIRQHETRVVSWRTLSNGRVMVAIVPMAGFSWLGSTLADTVRVGVFTLLVALALAVAFGHNLARPLTTLINTIKNRPLDGSAPYLPDFHTDDELGILARAFRLMMQDLRHTQGQLAQANYDLRQKVKQRTREMREQAALFEVSRAVTSTLQLERVLQEIVSHVQELGGSDGCALLLLQQERCELKASVGIDAALHPTSLPVQGVPMSNSGRPHVLRTDRLPDLWRSALERQGFNLMVTVPLSARGSAVGILCVYYKNAEVVLDEELNLLMTLGSQAAVAIENARLYEEQQHVTHLLRGILAPRDAMGFEGLEVGHRFHPSMELSGDYYDLIPRSEKRFDIVIADVAGKGPDAAIQTARAKHVIQAYACAGFTPARVLDLLNKQMVGPPDDLHLVTVFYAQVDVEHATMTYACAGHEPPVYWSPSCPEPVLLRAEGLLAGVTEDALYEEHTVPIEEGATLLLYTDGVTEARSSNGDFFGVHGLLDLVEREGNLPPQKLVNRIYIAVHRFSQGNLGDDLSLLALRLGSKVAPTEVAQLEEIDVEYTP